MNVSDAAPDVPSQASVGGTRDSTSLRLRYAFMHFVDYIVVACYLAVAIGLGIVFSGRQSRSEFFTAGRSMGWLPVGLSVMATLFSSNSFVFYPSAAYASSLRIGLSLVSFTLMAPLVAWVFIPVYSRLNCATAYQYLELRFGLAVRCLASGLFVLLRIGWMASATYSASLVIAGLANLDQRMVIVLLGAVSIAYTILGGLRAVMWTDVLQFGVFTSTILIALLLAFPREAGAPSLVINSYLAHRDTALFDFTPSMTLTYGSWAILIGVFLEALSAYGADQVAVQRYLSARTEKTSQFGLYVSILGMWLVVPALLLIGVGLYGHYGAHPQELSVLLTDPASRDQLLDLSGRPEEVAQLMTRNNLQDQVLPLFVRTHFPIGGQGLFLAALMAAIMSSIDSGIHSVTTAVVVDFRDRLCPGWKPADDAGDVLTIRALTVLIGVIAVGLAMFVGPLGDVFTIGKMMTAAFGGPLLAVFLLAFFSPRSTCPGVFFGTLISAGATLALMFLQRGWFAVWFWPIGFGLAMVLTWGLSLFPWGRSPNALMTYRSIMRDTAAGGGGSAADG